MKKTILIACLNLIAVAGFAQTKSPVKAAPKSNSNSPQKVVAAPSGTSSNSEKIVKQSTTEGNAAGPEVNPMDKSKAIVGDLLTSLIKSESKIFDKELLGSTSSVVATANNTDEFYNAIRTLIESAPADVYKSGNAEAGRQIAGSLNGDTELTGFNSLILKWEMLLNPTCFDAEWKTNEVKWKKQIQLAK